MRLMTILAISVALTLALIFPHTYSQAIDNTTYQGYDVSIYLGIHTINFTAIVGSGIEGSRGSIWPGGSNVSRILEAIKDISMGCDTLSCIAANRTARASIEQSLRELERTGYIDPGAVDEIIRSIDQISISDESLRRLLSNPEITQLISNIFAENSPLGVLGVLDSLFRGGRISLNEYIAALEFLKRISLSQGLQGEALTIDRIQLEIIRNLILSRTAEGLVRGLANILVSSNVSPQQIQQQQISSRSSLYPGYQRYPIYLPMPTGSLDSDQLYIVIAIVGVSILATIVVMRLSRKLLKIRALKDLEMKIKTSLKGYSGVVGIYWKAVEFVSRRVPRDKSETHREYLNKVRRLMGSRRSFEDLTEIYESVRYAHEPEDKFYERALKDYKELSSGESN
jgi:hypothetical protein